MTKVTVGIDWGSAEHAVCVLDEHAVIRATLRIPHSTAGLDRLLRTLARFGSPSEVAVAIERPTGLLVDTLLNAGHVVIPIHPNAVKASRPRYRAARSKADPGDAYLLADLLRTDGHRFRALRPQSDATRALRTLVRVRAELVAQRVALTNQLRALLECSCPGAVALFARLDSPTALAFLNRYPTATHVASLREGQLATFLRRHAYSGRRTAAELFARLHAAPVVILGPTETATTEILVRSLVAVLQALQVELQKLSQRLAQALAAHSDGPLVQSLPRTGKILAAQLLAELGDQRARFASAAHLAAEAGVAPVTFASGKSRRVTFRRACNKRLRTALVAFADSSRRSSPWAAHIYTQARARGCRHAHAVRVLARAWTRVLWHCWQHRTPYNAATHRAARELLAAA